MKILSTIALVLLCFLNFTYSTSFFNKFEKKVQKQVDKSFGKDNLILYNDSLIYNSKTFTILNTKKDTLGFGIINKTKACATEGCNNSTNSSLSNTYEYFISSTLYNTKNTLVNIKILEYHATKGYEITAKKWLKQFVGLQPSQVELDNTIDGISGATISTEALVNEIYFHDEILKTLQK